jgi:hypothetical protein
MGFSHAIPSIPVFQPTAISRIRWIDESTPAIDAIRAAGDVIMLRILYALAAISLLLGFYDGA